MKITQAQCCICTNIEIHVLIFNVNLCGYNGHGHAAHRAPSGGMDGDWERCHR